MSGENWRQYGEANEAKDKKGGQKASATGAGIQDVGQGSVTGAEVRRTAGGGDEQSGKAELF
jgi:hypothetical protein